MRTNIYAITDSHQESRNLCKLLSGIYNYEKGLNNPFLVLDCGDLFKGIYDKDLSVNSYIKLKQLLPQAQIVITLGNNDFGFYQPDFEYLKSTIENSKKMVFILFAETFLMKRQILIPNLYRNIKF